MKIVRASEIGTYLYCKRAWWYQLQGYEIENQAELAGGSEVHEKHGRVVITSNCLHVIAYGLLLLSVLMVTIWIIQQIL
jgi:CRISPR/Cas system-associated exonuclease Cas4 (RecB family)